MQMTTSNVCSCWSLEQSLNSSFPKNKLAWFITPKVDFQQFFSDIDSQTDADICCWWDCLIPPR